MSWLLSKGEGTQKPNAQRAKAPNSLNDRAKAQQPNFWLSPLPGPASLCPARRRPSHLWPYRVTYYYGKKKISFRSPSTRKLFDFLSSSIKSDFWTPKLLKQRVFFLGGSYMVLRERKFDHILIVWMGKSDYKYFFQKKHPYILWIDYFPTEEPFPFPLDQRKYHFVNR